MRLSHARFLAAMIGGIRIVKIYLPNGNLVGTDKFAYKLGVDRSPGVLDGTMAEEWSAHDHRR